MVYKVHLIGHSFVTRFKQFLKHNLDQYSYTLNLDPHDVMIQYSGLSGGSVQSLRANLLTDVHDFEPDFVFSDIGSNDLCNRHLTPDSVANSVLDLVDFLVHFANVRIVAVLQILHKIPPSCSTRHPVDTFWFNTRVDETNFLLSQGLSSILQVCFWWHKGFWTEASKQAVFSYDGTHLSHQGQVKYFKSLRALTVYICKWGRVILYVNPRSIRVTAT